MDATPAGPDGDQRLDGRVVPLSYVLDLQIDPASPKFAGTASIEVEIAEVTREIQMHAAELEISRAVAHVRGTEQVAEPVPGPNGGLMLRFAVPLPAGPARLDLTWTAALGEVPNGLYRARVGEAWYAYTQFEASHARQAFPSFDQPEFKTPYRVTLRVPLDHDALSNAPEYGREIHGEQIVVTFAETPPLPTYLVAFAVGPFDIVEASGGGAPPLRLVTTRGRGQLGAYALERTPLLLGALAEYFGSPYPYAKLDLVAVPNFSAGAMENVGLVTFRESLLLFDEASAPAELLNFSQRVIAHELAHMWFGNLVTPAWWDDLWLNESFATWMGNRVVNSVDPDREVALEQIAGTQWVMFLDAQQDARAIRQPIEHGGDVHNAFDAITYGKGARVLRMVERYLGSETFRRGVRAYIDSRPHGTATTEDLIAALSAASDQPVGEILGHFLDQPGVPLVRVDVRCDSATAGQASSAAADPGSSAPPLPPRPGHAELILSQRRYLPAGSTAPVGKPWNIPICVAYGIDGQRRSDCLVLRAPQSRFQLSAPGCPDWLHPNEDHGGYYVWQLEPSGLAALVGPSRTALSLAERVGLIGDLAVLLESGALGAPAYLDALVALSAEQHRLMLQGIIEGLRRVNAVAVTPRTRQAFSGLVRDLLAPHAARIGSVPKRGEPVAHRLLRPALLAALVELGDDEAVRLNAVETTHQFLADFTSVDDDQASLALPLAARSGDAQLWTKFREALERDPNPVARVSLIKALGAFRDPKLLRQSLDLTIDGPLRAQDHRTLLWGVADEAARQTLWTWTMERFDALRERLGEDAPLHLVGRAAGLCSVSERERVVRFFEPESRRPPGTDRNIRMVLEGIDRCIRLRAALSEPVERYLSQRAQ